MRRVLILTTFYPPYSFGGDGVDMQALALALARRGSDVTVVHDEDAYLALAPGPPPGPHESEPGVEVIRLKSRSEESACSSHTRLDIRFSTGRASAVCARSDDSTRSYSATCHSSVDRPCFRSVPTPSG